MINLLCSGFVLSNPVSETNGKTKIKGSQIEYNSNMKSSISRVENDTIKTNSIVSIWNNSDIYSAKVYLKDKDGEIDIGIYNMLGKEVLKVFKGGQSSDEQTYDFNVSKLPNGVYLCVLIGRNFRDVEKFIISR